ncbi:hypothetical protein JNJ66_04005 [Candidatus Saccharibacteria bacterium]|nr:hypothetical protein [Candidatus Saccharibacteria bacterium]
MSETLAPSGHADRQRDVQKFVDSLEAEGRLTPAVKDSATLAIDIRRRHDVVIYLAGALTGMPETVKHRYEQLHRIIGSYSLEGATMFGYAPHLFGTDPVAHPDVTPAEVRDIDHMFAAVVPDYHINCLDPVAHGNAIEEAWAEAAGIPSLYLAHQDTRLSRLTRGMRNIAGTVTYEDFTDDALPAVRQFLDGIQAERLGRSD